MAIVKVEKNTYTAEQLYQWDLNQELEIRGLSLASIPEVHFTNVAMSRAIVRQASMDAAGVVRVAVPNSLLQKPYKIVVYICTYAGATFETQYKLEISVKERTQPADYTLVDDPEVYSFNALENQLLNALTRMETLNADANAKLAAATAAQNAAKLAYDTTLIEVEDRIQTVVDNAVEELPTWTAAEVAGICE